MSENNTYIVLLQDILLQKQKLLQAIMELTSEQQRVLSKEEVSLEEFDEILPRKEKLIAQLNRLDNGFEDAYKKVQSELILRKEDHREEILALQEQISRLAELGVRIQAEEQRNRLALEQFLAGKRKQVRNFKISSQTASSYYKNMTGKPAGEAYFMDKRK